MKVKTVGKLVGYAFALMVSAAQADTINQPWNGSYELEWGPGAIGGGQAYGEIFTAPQAILNDYSFNLADENLTSFPFESQIFLWNGTTTVGPALYTSAPIAITDNDTTYTFMPNILLIPGSQYIAVVTNDSLGGNQGGTGRMRGSDSGPGGFRFEELDSPGVWFTYCGGGCDANFTANFSLAVETPLPAALPLFATGLGVLGLLGSRRKRKGVAAA